MYLRKLFIGLSSAMLTMFSFSLSAGSLTGGDAVDQASATSIVDIVFAIDTSGSMGDEATAISNAVQTAVTTLECPNIDVFIRARFAGLRGTWNNTIFDETAESVLSSVGDATTINHSEDNGPVVFDFATATNYFVDDSTAGQSYNTAVVTIGDEGLQGGAPVNQDDYDVGKEANDAAVANSLLVFSILGNNPSTGAGEAFSALAIGNATLGGHVFNDTGGAFTTTTPTTPFEEILENIFCQAAGPGPVPMPPVEAQPIPTLGEWSLIFLSALLGLVGFGRFRHQSSFR